MARTKQTARKSTGGKALRSHHPRMGRSSALALVLALLSSLGHSRAQVGPDALNSIAATFTPPVTPAVASVDLGDQPIAPATDLNRCLGITPDHQAYTLQRLANSNTTFDPFEHLTVHDIFDPFIYACMLAHLPKPKANYNSTRSQGLRSYVPLSDFNGKLILPAAFLKGQRKYIPATFQPFWRAFAKSFAGAAMRDAWIAKFHATLSRRFPDVNKAVGEHKMRYRLDLTRDGQGYFINPHTDSVAKVITILYYLPMDAKHPELGTVAFRSKTGLADDGRGMTWRDEERGDFRTAFETAVSGQFVPNTVFAFAPCTSAWHGVFKVTQQIQRDTLQGFVAMPMSADEKSSKIERSKSKVGAKIKGECVGPH